MKRLIAINEARNAKKLLMIFTGKVKNIFCQGQDSYEN